MMYCQFSLLVELPIRFLNTSLIGIETEPNPKFKKKQTTSTKKSTAKGIPYEVLVPNYSNRLKKYGWYSSSNSGWQILIISLNTRSGRAVPSS